jgi:peroxiredoxin
MDAMDARDALVGKKAPSFSMDTTAGRRSLEDYRGRTLVLAFFPLAFTGG